MRLTYIALLLIGCLTHSVFSKSAASIREAIDKKTDKRALTEGNAGVQKRAPLLVTSSPLTAVTPGIEYATSKEDLPNQSPPQQKYTTSSPTPLSKISDVLTGHGPSFTAAISNHLYSPYQAYQPFPKVNLNPAYTISAPVPYNLAYDEHKITYPAPAQQQQSPIPYFPVNTPKFFTQPQQGPFKPFYQPLNFAQATALSYTPAAQNSHLSFSPTQQLNLSPVQTHLSYIPQYQQFSNQGTPYLAPQVLANNGGPSGYNVQPQLIFSSPSGAGFNHQLPVSHTSYTAPGVVAKQAEVIVKQPAATKVVTNAPENQVYANSNKGAVSYASFSQSHDPQYKSVKQPTTPQMYQAQTFSTPAYLQQQQSVYTAPVQTYISPAHAQIVPAQAYSVPVQAYPAPAQAYSAPVQAYHAPAQAHTAPAQAYTGQTYSAIGQGHQGHNYVAPQQVAYSQPAEENLHEFPKVQYFGKLARSIFSG